MPNQSPVEVLIDDDVAEMLEWIAEETGMDYSTITNKAMRNYFNQVLDKLGEKIWTDKDKT
jgi:hypothetical protein